MPYDTRRRVPKLPFSKEKAGEHATLLHELHLGLSGQKLQPTSCAEEGRLERHERTLGLSLTAKIEFLLVSTMWYTFVCDELPYDTVSKLLCNLIKTIQV